MAGYSGTPLLQKLGIKPGSRVALLGAPPTLRGALTPWPSGATLSTRCTQSGSDVIVLFAPDRRSLAARFHRAAASLSPSGGLWIAWPKKTSGVTTDLSESVVRELGLAAGLVDNKVCAVDETWSALRFVIRLKDRPGPERA